jgi:hypothetical protein
LLTSVQQSLLLEAEQWAKQGKTGLSRSGTGGTARETFREKRGNIRADIEIQITEVNMEEKR